MWQIPLIEGHTDIKLQKKYMIENIIYMNKEVKMNILNMVVMDIDDSAGPPLHRHRKEESVDTDSITDLYGVRKEYALKNAFAKNILKQGKNGLNIDLDKLPEHVIQQMYDIICYRMEILNTPIQPRSKIHFRFCDED
jgi:hypothetical protein